MAGLGVNQWAKVEKMEVKKNPAADECKLRVTFALI